MKSSGAKNELCAKTKKSGFRWFLQAMYYIIIFAQAPPSLPASLFFSPLPPVRPSLSPTSDYPASPSLRITEFPRYFFKTWCFKFLT